MHLLPPHQDWKHSAVAPQASLTSAMHTLPVPGSLQCPVEHSTSSAQLSSLAFLACKEGLRVGIRACKEGQPGVESRAAIYCHFVNLSPGCACLLWPEGSIARYSTSLASLPDGCLKMTLLTVQTLLALHQLLMHSLEEPVGQGWPTTDLHSQFAVLASAVSQWELAHTSSTGHGYILGTSCAGGGGRGVVFTSDGLKP